MGLNLKKKFKRVKRKVLSSKLLAGTLGAIFGGMLPTGALSAPAAAALVDDTGGDQVVTPEAAPEFASAPGSMLSEGGGTFDEDEARKNRAINKKKLGARGLRIPLTSNKSTTAGVTGGVQI